jgi:hypothetical protein
MYRMVGKRLTTEPERLRRSMVREDLMSAWVCDFAEANPGSRDKRLGLEIKRDSGNVIEYDFKV